MSTVHRSLRGAIEPRPGLPLRVLVYDRVAEAIRSGTLAASSLLPSESELGEAMGVSRTVVREAVLLLEEDGLVRGRRGIGRFVADRVPTVGFERVQPIESLLRGRFPGLIVERNETTLQQSATPFISAGLAISSDSPSWFVESILSNDDGPVALVQEHLPAGDHLASFGDAVREAVEGGDDARTCLGNLTQALGVGFGSGRSEFSGGSPGRARAQLLRVRPTDPVLVVTQTLTVDGRALYLSKLILSAAAGTLSLNHSNGAEHARSARTSATP